MSKKSRSFIDHSGNAIKLFEIINRKTNSIPEKQLTLKEQFEKERMRKKNENLEKSEIIEEDRYIQISPNFRK